MTDISIYFNPISFDKENYHQDQIGGFVEVFKDEFPTLNPGSIAIIYVPENRGSHSKEAKATSSEFRKSFYELYKGKDWNKNFYDLGDILPGKELNDTYFAVSNVVAELIKSNVLPIIVGGSQDLVMGIYDAYAKLEQLVNICSIDYSLDLGDTEKGADSQSYLTPLMLKRPCYLFNHANIGLQIPCLLYTSDAADDSLRVDLGGRRIVKE